jgi:hypothetical protein
MMLFILDSVTIYCELRMNAKIAVGCGRAKLAPTWPLFVGTPTDFSKNHAETLGPPAYFELHMRFARGRAKLAPTWHSFS